MNARTIFARANSHGGSSSVAALETAVSADAVAGPRYAASQMAMLDSER